MSDEQHDLSSSQQPAAMPLRKLCSSLRITTKTESRISEYFAVHHEII